MTMKHLWMSMLAVCLLTACGTGMKKSDTEPASAETSQSADTLQSVQPRYAKGFTVRQLSEGIRLVDLGDPQREEGGKEYHFALVDKDIQPEGLPEGYTVVTVPIERCITMTTLQLSGFIALDALDFVSGMTSTKSLKNEEVNERVKDGRLLKIGIEGNFDPELIMAARPDVIFISPFKRGGYEALTESGITLVPHLGYKETTALGQAEWIKFLGMFLGMEREAGQYFAQVEKRYNEVKAKADAAESRPTVMSGEMHDGQWYAVGGRNSLAQMFRDAGADYIMKDNDDTGGVNMDFEEHYAKAANAQFWRILNAYDGDFSYDALLESDSRNADFRAFKERKVIYCNMKQTAYYEQAPMHPDQLLADLVAVFHPELLPKDYQPVFYRLLK